MTESGGEAGRGVHSPSAERGGMSAQPETCLHVWRLHGINRFQGSMTATWYCERCRVIELADERGKPKRTRWGSE